ncbi:MAG: caspase family protein, partial [Deltaproteobacteria bacterium]|nr:caspase family protein [Deltaproteobacteria bacterium]
MTTARTGSALSLSLLLGCAAARPSLVPATSAAAAPVAPAEALAWGDTPGALERGTTPALDDGRLARTYAIELAAGERVRLALRSTVFDARLVVDGPTGLHIENDDAFPGSTHAAVVFVAPAAGRYTVRASTLDRGESGAYTLRAERLAAADGAALATGATVDATLDPAAEGAAPGRWFHFEARGGSRVRLRVTSTAFDTVATVLGPRGEVWLNDDANDLGPARTERPLDSTLEVVIPESGTYHLVVTAFGTGGAGAFRVAASERAPVLLRAGEEVPAGGYAGADGRGRVLGLYAGITAYAAHSTLYGCADDARFLGEAMRAAHLQGAGDQEVLVDGAATRAAFTAGLARIAARARPEDVVVVFFSGHGNVRPAPDGDRTELDGVDETIELADGPLVDTELAAALAGVRAGTVILALDSCHAGGFADDWVTRPGRIGLFSSDADVLSDTAEPRRAGGYLSWHLRRAVLGEADARPRDGVLQAGELTDYLYAGFVADHERMNRPGSNDPYQRLEAPR